MLDFFARVYNFFRRKAFRFLDKTEDYLYGKHSTGCNEKTLLLLRLDSIGDYILFRNFIRTLKFSDKYKDYKISLCGNNWWRELSEKLDAGLVDQFIWVDYKKMSGFFYRMRVYRKVHSAKFEVLMHPTFSRDVVGDELVAHSGAAIKIGYAADLINLSQAQRQKYDKVYSRLVLPEKQYQFEFYRNAYFFEKVLNQQTALKRPILDLPTELGKRIVICPGAKHAFRRWSPLNFAALINQLRFDFKNHEFVICGSREDSAAAIEIMNLSEQTCIDQTGKLSIFELLGVLAGSKLVVTNDSGPFHMAVALGKNTVCISNGNNYGRFTPYPKSMETSSLTIYPSELLQIKFEQERLDRFCKEGSPLDINSIGVQAVYEGMKEKFNQLFHKP